MTLKRKKVETNIDEHIKHGDAAMVWCQGEIRNVAPRKNGQR
jgi:hypothetical protein